MAHDYAEIRERAEAFFAQSERFPAGFEYSAALEKLGFDPEIVCWIYMSAEDRVELAIITTMVDRIGPLPMYELLFEASGASALPREIDPFEVSLYSPNTRMGVELLSSLGVDGEGLIAVGAAPADDGPRDWIVIGTLEPMIVPRAGLYRVKQTIRNADQDRARWQRFKSNIQALAA